jgi:hypothetical protein
LEAVDGGFLEDVTISNITMRDIKNSPIFLRLGSRLRGPEGVPVGTLRRIIIDNVVIFNADTKSSVIISGIPQHDIENIQMSNIQIYYKGGGTKEQAAINPPEKENDYPEPDRLGEMPAYGFFIRHVKNINMSNIEVSFMENDFRPPFVLHNVKDAEFNFINAQTAKGISTFILKDVENIKVHQSQSVPDTKLEKAENSSL